MKPFSSFIYEATIDVPKKQQTMGIDRKDMPQVSSKDMTHFFNHLKTKGVTVVKKKMDPSDLKASQGQFHKEKIQKMIDDIQNGKDVDKPIVVSKDNYVVDGHHRWLAHSNLGKDVNAYHVNTNAKDLIGMMHDYPKSFNSKLYETLEYFVERDESCMIVTAAHMKAFEQFVDKMFDKFNIDFDFTKHFRERISDERNNPCISLKEIADTIKKIYNKYKSGEKTLSKYVDAEVVLKDLQNDLNMPIAVEYDRKNDEIEVVAKTIMRKKNFRTPNPEIKL